MEFKGFEAGYKKSNISGLNRLFYDRSKPFTKNIRYYNYFLAKDIVRKPNAYIIPQAWSNVIDLLKLNNIGMHVISKDTTLEVKCYYIDDYKTVAKPYEGHYIHSNVSLIEKVMPINFHAGDYIIACNQIANRFIIETLEPKAVDSYFNWNYFDSALQQKEWFSDYVYEETAEKVLKDNPNLQIELNQYVKEHQLQNNHWEQLVWIFKHAPQYEQSAFRYPVFRLD
jgi:hypothetical protein